MIENIKVLLGEAANNFTEAQMELCLNMAVAEVEAYCNRVLDAELELIAQRIAVIKLYRLNSEGLSAQSFSGVNESYLDGYPADIQKVLNRKRRVKFL
jgi:hypothetical protein